MAAWIKPPKNCEVTMKCRKLMTGNCGLAFLLILALIPRAFAQNELNGTPAAQRESTDSAIPERDLGVNKVNLPSPIAFSRANIVTNDATASGTAPLSPWATDVVKLAGGGIDDQVIQAF